MNEAAPLIIVREYRATPALVFSQWTDPEALADWFAPDPFEVTQSTADARPHGKWHVVYRSVSGEEWNERGAFVVLEPPHYLELTLQQTAPDGTLGPLTVARVRFEQIEGGTRMVFEQSGFDSPALRDAMREGWGECFDRLNLALSKRSI